ncbi:MAG: hypothetical protein IRZ31_15290 [Thermogemmatispora sp.]|jgi:hypothetical protein|uniref:Uncharacterized protein n=1 Tax=Thermogemmatispora aurantia TaxID=2045279 RepID=A0A5J4K8N7_9CHLR|nr:MULTISPECIES: hypothetical protein [Thermogemmatispora]MBE3566429.1 hypothetical protein [Thermogemmatispora sp.]MBX5458256.1 hypothetical protein [Thermogemmatispora sp.]GER83060.1 hypothetical protein KTAU_16970 [Thermogemmatispora aurantia]
MTQTTGEASSRPIEIVDQPEEEQQDQRLTVILVLAVTVISALITFLIVRRLLGEHES